MHGDGALRVLSRGRFSFLFVIVRLQKFLHEDRHSCGILFTRNFFGYGSPVT